MPGVNEQLGRRPSYGERVTNGNRNFSYYYNNGNSREPMPTTNGHRDRHHSSHVQQNGKGGLYRSAQNGSVPNISDRRQEEDGPSYWVEHLATFAVGRQYGLEWPADGIRKLKQMERSSAIWAQPMVLHLRRNAIIIEDENHEIAEQFPLELVAEPTAHVSGDPRDLYNNLLLFVVREDRKKKTTSPTEMHIFQCSRVSATEVVDDVKSYLQGKYNQVKSGRRENGFASRPQQNGQNGAGLYRDRDGLTYTRSETREVHGGANDFVDSSRRPPSRHQMEAPRMNGGPPVAAGPSSAAGYQNGRGPTIRTNGFGSDDYSVSDAGEYFERDVNTLNRCFDEVERFVARIQQAALAQREIEARAQKMGGKKKALSPGEGLLALRAQLPSEIEFVDILQKFKLCFNLLAKLKNHIHEPNAPELLHFLFTPLTVILDACRWGLGENIGPRVVNPLITRDAKDLMLNCLTSKESDVWNSLGDAWKIPAEDWPHQTPTSFHPVFADGFAPYGPPVEERRKPPSRHASVNNLAVELEMDKLSLEKEKINFEKERLEDRARRLAEEERKLEDERRRLLEERQRLAEEQERASYISEPPQRPVPPPQRAPAGDPYYQQRTLYRESAQSSPIVPSPAPVVISPSREHVVPVMVAPMTLDQSPRHRAFLEDLQARRAHICQVTYDRVGQNVKELTVSKGEYLEVLNDSRNWWECRNVHQRVGYVPKTILMEVTPRQPPMVPLHVDPPAGAHYHPQQPTSSGPPSSSFPSQDQSAAGSSAGAASPMRPGNTNGGGRDTPDYIKQRQGKRGNAIPPAPAPPPPLLQTNSTAEALRNVQLRPVYFHKPQENGVDRVDESTPQLQTTQRNQDAFQTELHQTLHRKDLLKMPRQTNGQLKAINEFSTETEISEWLENKGFSMRTMKVLESQTGATLFCLTKLQLQQFCGKEEGNRLYSQLLIMKNTSGYKTKSAAELKAILQVRKEKVEDKSRMNGHADYDDDEDAPVERRPQAAPREANRNSLPVVELFNDGAVGSHRRADNGAAF